MRVYDRLLDAWSECYEIGGVVGAWSAPVCQDAASRGSEIRRYLHHLELERACVGVVRVVKRYREGAAL